MTSNVALEVRVFRDGVELQVAEVDARDSADPSMRELVVYIWDDRPAKHETERWHHQSGDDLDNPDVPAHRKRDCPGTSACVNEGIPLA